MPKLTTHKPLTNRAAESTAGGPLFTLPEDGFVQLVALGEAPIKAGGKPIIQVSDRAALEAMLNRLVESGGELLIDDDHLSHDVKQSTDANGWLPLSTETLQLREDGLYGAPRWTSLGLEKLHGGVKRFISPEFDPATITALGGARFRVNGLTGLALTNRPNYGDLQRALCNNSGSANAPADNPTHPMHKTLLALALGLPETEIETLDEAALTAKVQALLDRLTAAEKSAADMKKKDEADATAFVNRHKPELKVLADPAVAEALRQTFLHNRDTAIAMVDAWALAAAGVKLTEEQKRRAEREPLHNRKETVIVPADNAPDAKAVELANRRRVHAEAALHNKKVSSWSAAWSEAVAAITE